MPSLSSLPARLREKIAVDAVMGCWIWTGSTHPKGYGQVKNEAGGVENAHRVVYRALVGAIPDGLTLDHLCRKRWCVNPRHLEPVSGIENVRRGVGPSVINGKKTKCPNGHPLDGNSYAPPSRAGRGECRECKRERNKMWMRVNAYGWATPTERTA